MANGASKTMGLAKFSAKFMGLAVSFSNDYASRSLDFFPQTCLAESDFFKPEKAAKYRFVSILYTCMNLDNIGTSQACI